MEFSKEFFDLQVRFARHVADLSGVPLASALLDYTNLYIRFGLGRGFDRHHPVWREYLNGLTASDDCEDWTYRFYRTRPRDVPPPSLAATFGCFSYASLPEDRIRLHFRNAETTDCSPLSRDRAATRRSELRALFQHVRRAGSTSREVVGVSWLYNLESYRRLFPKAYIASAKTAGPRFRNMPLWGQFLDRHGAVRPGMAEPFLARLVRLKNQDDIGARFPLRPLEVRAPVADFVEFYK